jgi:hypothetical protein
MPVNEPRRAPLRKKRANNEALRVEEKMPVRSTSFFESVGK